MPRLSITLTESQAAALERIAAETGATKQSMIGLAVSAWIRENDVLPMPEPKTPEIGSQDDRKNFVIVRNGVEVAWMIGRWESDEHKAILAEKMKNSKSGPMQDLGGRVFRHVLQEGDFASVRRIQP